MSQFTRLGAVTMDDEIAALLNSVQQKAMQINDESLRKTIVDGDTAEGAQDQKDISSSSTNQITLPSHLKMLVLSYVDEATRSKALRTPMHLRLPPVKLRSNLTNESALRIFTLEELDKLEQDGYIVKDNFINDESFFDSLVKDVNAMLDSGVLKLAGMNQGAQQWRDRSLRGDYHAWVNDRDRVKLQWPALATLLEALDAIRLELNQCCAFNCSRTQTQVACYPGEGARYVRHLDAFEGGTNRRLTCLYYMNKNWQPEHGGQLRLYLPDPSDPTGDREITKHIEPLADRLLIFQSRTIEHEVLPSHVKRFSITMWFY